MNILLWIAAGALASGLSYYVFRFNRAWSLGVSLAIGFVGAGFGGSVLGPLVAGTVAPGDFNPVAWFTAFASAAGCLIISNMIRGSVKV